MASGPSTPIKRLGKQSTYYYDHEVEMSKGTRSINITMTTDSRGKTPTGGFTAKVTSGLLSLEEEDQTEFLQKWQEVGKQAYDSLLEKIHAIGQEKSGETAGQLRLEGTDGQGVSGAKLTKKKMKEADVEVAA